MNRVVELSASSRSTVLRLIARGELEAVRFGKRGTRVTALSLARYLERQKLSATTSVA